MVDEHVLVFITYFLWILLVEVIYGETEAEEDDSGTA